MDGLAEPHLGAETARALRALRLLRLRPLETDTAEARAQERYRRLALCAGASALAKCVRILSLIVSVPLTIRYLGNERYGLWMTISSAVAMFAFADLGTGNGLLNAVSDANGRDDKALAARYVSSAYFLLLGVAVVIGATLVIVLPFVHWKDVFNVRPPLAVAEAAPAVAVLLGCFLLGLPAGVAHRVQMAYQEGFTNSIWEALGSILGLIGILMAIRFGAGLPWLVLAMAGGPIVALLLNGIVLFWWRRPYLRPSWHRADRIAAIGLLRVGVLFFVLQAVAAAAFLSDNFVAAQTLGASAVTQYDVPMKLFDMVGMIAGLWLVPLWPAYGEAMARGDVGWVRCMLKRSVLGIIVGTGAASLALVLFGGTVVRMWTGSAVQPTMTLLIGLAVWTVLKNAGTAAAMFMNGINVIRFQAASAVCMGIVALALKVELAKRFGLPGIVWGTVTAYLVCELIPLGVYVPRLLAGLPRRASRRTGQDIRSSPRPPLARA
jgi:O-antigen/teichoic acid export membrane protein